MRRNDKDKETIKAIEVDEAIRQQFTRDPKAEAIKVPWGQTHPIPFPWSARYFNDIFPKVNEKIKDGGECRT